MMPSSGIRRSITALSIQLCLIFSTIISTCLRPTLVHGFVPAVSPSQLRLPRSNSLSINGNSNNDEGVDQFYGEDVELTGVTVNGSPPEMPSDAIGMSSSNFNGYSKTSGYSPFLDKKTKNSRNNNGDDLDEDGYADMMKRGKQRSFWKKVVKFPVHAAKFILNQGIPTKEPGTLILVRHGESTWNRNKTFTGWSDDADLTEQGTREMEHAARLLMEQGYEIDVVFTSRLRRAIRSVWILLQELNEVYVPVFKSWRINERHYGSLTGLSKTQTAERLGAELVQEWRGSLRSRPPPMAESHPYYPGRERKYADLTKDQIPLTESLLDCMERTIPLWENKIVYELMEGRNVLVVAHANTLRGLVKTIDNIGDAEIQDVAIPTGIPIVYKFEKDVNGVLRSTPPCKEEHSVSQVHMNGKFLEKPGLLKEALKREAEWSQSVPGYEGTMSRHKRPMTGLERSLYKLEAERELGKWASEFIDWNALEDDGNDGNFGKPIALSEDEVWAKGMKELENGEQFDPDAPIFHDLDEAVISTEVEESIAAGFAINVDDEDDDDDDTEVVPNFFAQPCVTAVPGAGAWGSNRPAPTRLDSVIVIIRHGKTQHNKLGLFTGWEDAPLADEGIEEAKEAGRLLKLHGFEFDVVYTSWLTRALETALYVMDEMDSLWLPTVKTWRLNERMYGELTGLSKQMVKQRHGEKQFKAWRRGYNVKPPAVSSFSPHYPGNDERYQKYLRDVRYSFKESVIRSIEKGRVILQRKLPKTESLKDCMDRTVPYFVERIAKDAVDQKKRVLISSSENAIRGLLMHLCDIPESEITGLEIPNGLPLIYDVRSKCVKLLDDGTGRDPLETYDFGDAAKYLFRPCQNEDGSLDEECTINFGGVNLSLEDQATIDYIKSKSTVQS